MNWKRPQPYHQIALALVLAPLAYLPTSIDPAGSFRWLWLQLVGMTMIGRLDRLPARRTLQMLGLLLSWSLLSGVWAMDKGSALLSFFKLWSMVPLVLGAFSLARDRRAAAVLVSALALSALPVAVIGLVQAMGVEVWPFEQAFAPASTFVNRNQASEYVAALTPICLGLMLLDQHRARGWLFASGTGLCLAFIVLARSRASWLALTVGLLCLGLLFSRKPLRTLLIRARGQLLTRLGVLLLAFYLFSPGPQQQGLASRDALGREWGSFSSHGQIEGEGVNTLAVRKALYHNSLAMFLDAPLLGHGAGNFSVEYPSYHQRVVPTPTFSLTTEPLHTHADLLQILVELGLPGLALFAAVLYGFLSGPLPSKPGEMVRRGLPLCCLITLGSNSLFSFPLQQPLSAALFWMALGLYGARGKDQPLPTGLKWGALAFQLLPLLLFLLATLAGILRLQAVQAYQRGSLEQARALSAKAMVIFPLDWRAHDELVSMVSGQRPVRGEDLAVVEAFVARRPYSPNAHFRHAVMLFQLNRPREALAALERAKRYLGSEDPKIEQLRDEIQTRMGGRP